MAYEMNGCIRYSETDSNGILTIDGLINYFQDCSFSQSEHVGYGLDYLRKQHTAWILSAWQIQIQRLPRLNEEVVVKTWPYDFKNFFGYRNFIMTTRDGQVLANANSLWIYLDTETGHPTKVPEDELAAYGLETAYPMPALARKLKLPKELTEQGQMLVPPYFIDTNHHMNNGKYVLVAMEYLPKDWEIETIKVEYRKAAMLNDMLFSRVKEAEQSIIVSIEDEEQQPYAIVEFTKKQ